MIHFFCYIESFHLSRIISGVIFREPSHHFKEEKIMRRRDFLNTAITGSVTMIAGANSYTRQSRMADANIEILIDEPIGIISPEIYGHFVEHLGGVVYDGIWVGENSKVPNIGGIRQALVEAMKKIQPASCAGREGVSPTATIGVTALDREISVPAGQISG